MNYDILVFFIFIIISIFLVYRVKSNNIILGTYQPYPIIITDNGIINVI